MAMSIPNRCWELVGCAYSRQVFPSHVTHLYSIKPCLNNLFLGIRTWKRRLGRFHEYFEVHCVFLLTSVHYEDTSISSLLLVFEKSGLKTGTSKQLDLSFQTPNPALIQSATLDARSTLRSRPRISFS